MHVAFTIFFRKIAINCTTVVQIRSNYVQRILQTETVFPGLMIFADNVIMIAKIKEIVQNDQK